MDFYYFALGIFSGVFTVWWVGKIRSCLRPKRKKKTTRETMLYHFFFGVRAKRLRRIGDECLVIYPDDTLEYWKVDECSQV